MTDKSAAGSHSMSGSTSAHPGEPQIKISFAKTGSLVVLSEMYHKLPSTSSAYLEHGCPMSWRILDPASSSVRQTLCEVSAL